MIRVSVIIPTLNEAVSVKTTIDAVKALGEDIEIIVVDGGSRDETSSRRFERRSFLLMFSRWSFLQILFGSELAHIFWHDFTVRFEIRKSESKLSFIRIGLDAKAHIETSPKPVYSEIWP